MTSSTCDGARELTGGPGRTNVQVDTNSEVEDGKGLLLALSADLARQGSIELPGPRDVQLRALRRLRDGRLVFAGMRDGPLTHTDPAMTFNDGIWGVARRPGGGQKSR